MKRWQPLVSWSIDDATDGYRLQIGLSRGDDKYWGVALFPDEHLQERLADKEPPQAMAELCRWLANNVVALATTVDARDYATELAEQVERDAKMLADAERDYDKATAEEP